MGAIGRVVLVRHGECVYEESGRVAGLVDTELTVLGRQRARECAQAVIDLELRFPTVLTSPLTRALETARVVAAALHAPVQPHWQLLDRHVGAWTGWRAREIAGVVAAHHPGLDPEEVEPPQRDDTHPARVQVSYGWQQWPVHARRPAETVLDVRERVAGFVEGPLRAARSGGDVVVVSHATPLRALFELVDGSRASAGGPPKPGAVTSVLDPNQKEGQS